METPNNNIIATYCFTANPVVFVRRQSQNNNSDSNNETPERNVSVSSEQATRAVLFFEFFDTFVSSGIRAHLYAPNEPNRSRCKQKVLRRNDRGEDDEEEEI